MSDENLVVLSCIEDEYNIVNPYVAWVIDLVASYHVAPNKEIFISYKARDFNEVKMGNCSYTKVLWVREVCVQTNIGYTLTLTDMWHI